MTREETVALAEDYFSRGYACSQSVLLAFSWATKIDENIAKRISSTFGGGMGRLRQKCGALTGGFMVQGLLQGYDQPNDMETKLDVYKKVRELNKTVEDKFGTSACNELIIKYSTPERVQERNHHKDICQTLVGFVAGNLYDMLLADGKLPQE